MKYETLIETIIENIPEIQERANEESRWWQPVDNEEPLVYIFMGNIINPFLIDLLDKMEDQNLIDRVFELFEIMAKSDDNRIRDVLSAGVLEVLGDDPKILEKARSFMRTNTLLLSHETEMSWGRE